jgi:hypothetical protein
MKSLITACGGAILAAALATPASAQLLGTYTGTSADGQSVSFTVTTDPNNSAPEITSATVWFSAPCKNSTYTLDEGEGWGPGADIAARKVTSVISIPGFYNKFSLTFSTNGQTATGTTLSIAPYLNPATSPPHNSLFCESAKQTMSLTYSGPDVRTPAVHGQLVYDRKGRVIGEQLHH